MLPSLQEEEEETEEGGWRHRTCYTSGETQRGACFSVFSVASDIFLIGYLLAEISNTVTIPYLQDLIETQLRYRYSAHASHPFRFPGGSAAQPFRFRPAGRGAAREALCGGRRGREGGASILPQPLPLPLAAGSAEWREVCSVLSGCLPLTW